MPLRRQSVCMASNVRSPQTYGELIFRGDEQKFGTVVHINGVSASQFSINLFQYVENTFSTIFSCVNSGVATKRHVTIVYMRVYRQISSVVTHSRQLTLFNFSD
jgi:hypothetical protein